MTELDSAYYDTHIEIVLSEGDDLGKVYGLRCGQGLAPDALVSEEEGQNLRMAQCIPSAKRVGSVNFAGLPESLSSVLACKLKIARGGETLSSKSLLKKAVSINTDVRDGWQELC